MDNNQIELSFLSIFTLITFFIFLIISKSSFIIRKGILLDKDFLKPQAFHKSAIGRVGGLAGIISLNIFFIIYNLIYSKILFEYLFLCNLMFLIGFLDDLKIKISPSKRLALMIIFLFPFSVLFEAPWNASPTIESTLSLLYLGVVATGLAWLIRFRILTVNGLVFQTQVAYLIPIFGIFFGYFLMDEIITWKAIASLVVILVGIYIFKKNNKGLVK